MVIIDSHLFIAAPPANGVAKHRDATCMSNIHNLWTNVRRLQAALNPVADYGDPCGTSGIKFVYNIGDFITFFAFYIVLNFTTRVNITHFQRMCRLGPFTF